MGVDLGNIANECKRLRELIEIEERLGNKLRLFELKQELEFLEQNFPEECGGKPSRNPFKDVFNR